MLVIQADDVTKAITAHEATSVGAPSDVDWRGMQSNPRRVLDDDDAS